MKRLLAAIAILILAVLGISHTASAQEIYDVKVASADNGLPDGHFEFGAEFDNGEIHQIAITSEGVFEYPKPPAARNLVAIIFQGKRFPVTSRNLLCIPWGNGCWCLCLRWVNYFPLRWPRLFWYYNPCCP